MTLSEGTRSKIEQLVSLYPERRTALLPALKLAQSDAGWLPRMRRDLFTATSNPPISGSKVKSSESRCLTLAWLVSPPIRGVQPTTTMDR